MKKAPKDESRNPEDRTRVTLRSRWTGPTPPTTEGRFVESAEITHELDGRLAGYTAHIPLELIDGRAFVSEIRYRPAEPMPLTSATATALKDLRLGDLIGTLELCLERMGEQALPWIDAIASERRRAGRHGTSPLRLAKIAARRVQSEQKAPGDAIRYMRQTWPELVGDTDAAVHGRVHRAINAKGGPMLEKDSDGLWQLTARAVDLLSDTRGEPQ